MTRRPTGAADAPPYLIPAAADVRRRRSAGFESGRRWGQPTFKQVRGISP